MSTKLGKIIADFTTSLATSMAVGATTATLQSATDDDGNALPSGVYFFAIDGNNAQKEHIVATLSGTSLTAISSVSRQGVQASGVVRTHRVGSTVTLTDFAHIKYHNDLLNGTTDLDSTTPLKYDGTASITNANHLATKAYADGIAIAGGADSSTTVKGITKMSVAPASATSPIAVGDNDPRVPTTNQINAMAGTSGTSPSGSNKFVDNADNRLLPTGAISPFAGITTPSGWLLCDGSAVSRTTYTALLAVISPAQTFTVTIASPAVVSATAHGLQIGDKIRLTTTGALPTGLAAATDYFVITAGFGANSFQVSASRGGAAVNTSGSQSGVHTMRFSNYGVGDGSTTFNVPDLRGLTVYGQKTADTNFDNLNSPTIYPGEKTHTLTTAEIPAHTHTYVFDSGGAVANGTSATGSFGLTTDSGSTGGGGSHNNMPPYVVMQYIIKT